MIDTDDRDLGDRDTGCRDSDEYATVTTRLAMHHYELLVQMAKARGRSVHSITREIIIKAVIPQTAGARIDGVPATWPDVR